LKPEKRDQPDPPPPPPEPTEPDPPPETRPPDISDQETRDIINRGIEHNRSPEDIKQDLDGLSHARGGVDVPMPDWVESVETPKGLVTATAAEAEEYRRALTELQETNESLDSYRDLIRGNQDEITKWSQREQNWVVRWLAGLDHLREERLRYLGERQKLADELARINRTPDPMTYDGEIFDSYEDAKNPVRRAQLSADVRDRMDALQRDHKKRVERATQTTESDGRPYPMPPDIHDAAYDREDGLADLVTGDSEAHARARAWERDFRAAGMAERGEQGSQASEREPSSRDGASTFNRPYEELRRWAREQERLFGEYRTHDAELDRLQETIDEFEARAGSA
jgi:hypothetical protein